MLDRNLKASTGKRVTLRVRDDATLIKVGADIPVDEWREFQSWCADRGYVQRAATRAAVGLFLRLPIEVRELALRRDWEGIAVQFRDRMVEAPA